jgi:hypothetical protein
MTPYQIFLLAVLVLWPFFIFGLLFAMRQLESWVNKSVADSPAEAGLEPVSGDGREREVTIVFGDRVIGNSR